MVELTPLSAGITDNEALGFTVVPSAGKTDTEEGQWEKAVAYVIKIQKLVDDISLLTNSCWAEAMFFSNIHAYQLKHLHHSQIN